ncbi:hypothetical protein ACFRCG_03350 [Embleya sp. NPDC056575]|uniref:hypothetical protein n=1 Tax=unclassified Embleya TaxID=2699296 RepID=UPI0036BB14F3
MTAKTWAWVGGVVAGAALVGLAVYLVVVGLDEADKWASVLGLFVALVGLVVSVVGVWRERTASGGQSVTDGVIAGGVAQVSDTGGNVRITRRGTGPVVPPSATPGAPPSAGDTAPADGQRVHGGTVSGPVDQVQGTDGDVDIEEVP